MTVPQRLLKRLADLEERQRASDECPGGWDQVAAESRERDAILNEIRALAGPERWNRHREAYVAAAKAFHGSDRGRAAADAFHASYVASAKELVCGLGADAGNRVLRLLLREREILLRRCSLSPAAWRGALATR